MIAAPLAAVVVAMVVLVLATVTGSRGRGPTAATAKVGKLTFTYPASWRADTAAQRKADFVPTNHPLNDAQVLSKEPFVRTCASPTVGPASCDRSVNLGTDGIMVGLGT